MRRDRLTISPTFLPALCSESPSANAADTTAAQENAEVWRPIPSAHGYEASSLGRIRRSGNEKALAPRVHPRGYRIVDVSIDGRAISKTVHRLVAEAFHGPALGRQTNHLSGDKADNRPANLEWVTAQQNTDHAFATGLRRRPAGLTRPGEWAGRLRIAAACVLAIVAILVTR